VPHQTEKTNQQVVLGFLPAPKPREICKKSKPQCNFLTGLKLSGNSSSMHVRFLVANSHWFLFSTHRFSQAWTDQLGWIQMSKEASESTWGAQSLFFHIFSISCKQPNHSHRKQSLYDFIGWLGSQVKNVTCGRVYPENSFLWKSSAVQPGREFDKVLYWVATFWSRFSLDHSGIMKLESI
jgi:hypothetical protein